MLPDETNFFPITGMEAPYEMDGLYKVVTFPLNKVSDKGTKKNVSEINFNISPPKHMQWVLKKCHKKGFLIKNVA